MQKTAAPSSGRSIKIFLASPGDVQLERDALSSLIREINDVLAFLVPDCNLQLELLKYETHTYPDVGQAQEVINKQIPVEYDIFIGVMWKRCGTPTASSQSGTIEEFQRALARRERTGRPVIMFYFCDEPVPFPKPDDLEQLTKVVRFREELASKGYTLSYPTRTEFRDYVRSGLLRAVADLLRKRVEADQDWQTTSSVLVAPEEDRNAVAQLAKEYEQIRETMPSGRERTNKLEEITAALRLRSAAVRSLLGEYQNSHSAGLRLAAICILQQFPNSAKLEWLVDRLDSDKEPPFIGYAAAVALIQAVRSLPLTDAKVVRSLADALKRALYLAERFPHDSDRLRVLITAMSEFKVERECRADGASKDG